jgi:AAA domain
MSDDDLADQIAADEYGSARIPTLFKRADELLSEAPVRPVFVWEHALAKGATTLFAKKPKVGGSTLTYGLIEAIANGEADYLGRKILGGPVVCASEEGHATLGSTFPRHKDIYLATRETAWPKPGWRELIADAAEAVRRVEAVLAVIDTFSFWNSLGPDAEKDAGSVQPLIDALIEITQTGCSVCLGHHHRKGGGEDGDALRGTTAIAGGVDCFCELEKIEDAPATHRRLVITPRWEAPPVLVLDYSRASGYRVIGQAIDREQSGEIGWTDRILEAIPDTGEGVTLDELGKLLSADRRKWHKTFASILAKGQVQRTGKGGRWDPYKHLRLAVPSSRPTDRTETDGKHGSVLPSCRIHTEGRTNDADAVQRSNGTARTEGHANLSIEDAEAIAAEFEETVG